ncbi:MAG: MFS transporter [Chloroflexi bacterium]|nr:MFS transporter [Chloroflexota bacterium]
MFWLPAPLGVVLLVAAIALFPRDAKVGKTQLDMAGGVLLAGGVTMALLALSGMGDVTSLATLLPIVFNASVGIALIVLLMRRERRIKNPIIEAEILKRKPFLAANVYNFVFGGFIHITSSLIPLFAVSVYGLSTAGSGFALTPKSVASLSATIVTSLLLRRWGYRIPMLLGCLIIAASLLLLVAGVTQISPWGASLGGVGPLLVILFVAGLGSGIANPASNNACIELMPDKVGSIMGVRGMFRHTGGAFAISVATLILHLSSSPGRGFAIIFLMYAFAMFSVIPLIYLMPRGERVPTKERKPQWA